MQTDNIRRIIGEDIASAHNAVRGKAARRIANKFAKHLNSFMPEKSGWTAEVKSTGDTVDVTMHHEDESLVQMVDLGSEVRHVGVPEDSEEATALATKGKQATAFLRSAENKLDQIVEAEIDRVMAELFE